MARKKTRRGRSYSKLNHEKFHLDEHDEEKLILFVSGIVFGVGIVSAILDKVTFGGLALIAVGVILLLIETRQ